MAPSLASRRRRRWGLGSIALAAACLLLPILPGAAEAAPSRERGAGPASPAAAARSPANSRRVAELRRPAQPRRMPAGPRAASHAKDHRGGDRQAREHRTRDGVRLALEQAAHATGMDGGVLQRIAERESRLDPRARSRSSSATGLMQFTRDTWLEAVRDFGPRHGLTSEAAALATDREGRITTRDPRTMQRVLGLRENPRYSAVLAAERLQAARPELHQVLGREAKPADLYLVHLLGPTGARRFMAALRTTPQRSSVAVLGDPARANPGVFLRGGEPLPLARAYAELERMFDAPLQIASSGWPQLD
ncbi:MAG TPA: transglycosylase SLT domain-containing protein [Roseococcus sp.]|nr:transglycosylase SLT domain-containing protein [Roseococcus sp.]